MFARASETALKDPAPPWTWSSGSAPSRSECLDQLQRLRERIAETAVHDGPTAKDLQGSPVRDGLQAEDQYLRHEGQGRLTTGVIVGQSAALRRVLEQARQVATTDSTVLLLGETGTGKSSLPRAFTD
jgi:transcriptional regulator with GAF, ATPase, and Fis domain